MSDWNITTALGKARRAYHGRPDTPDTCQAYRESVGYASDCPCEDAWRSYLPASQPVTPRCDDDGDNDN